jgi:tagatose 6-phosphate kinase
MIVVLSLNTAIDRTLLVPHFRPGEIYRAERVHAGAGGKGLNVARTLRQLGEPVRVVGFLGGPISSTIRERCTAHGIEAHWVEIAQDSRTCVVVVDPHASGQTVLNEPGPQVTLDEVRRLRDQIARVVHDGDLVCLSGSAPPGATETLYAELVAELQGRGARVLVDVSGRPLAGALESHPWAVKPNEDECRAALGLTEPPEDLAIHLARHAGIGLLTLGGDGVLVAQGTGLWRVHPPRIQAVNAVGSGDAFAAGFLAGIARGESVLDAVRLATACGAANAGRFEPSVGSHGEVEELARQVYVEQLGITPGE